MGASGQFEGGWEGGKLMEDDQEKGGKQSHLVMLCSTSPIGIPFTN